MFLLVEAMMKLPLRLWVGMPKLKTMTKMTTKMTTTKKKSIQIRVLVLLVLI